MNPGGQQTERQIDRKRHRHDLHRLTGLVQRRAGKDGKQIRVGNGGSQAGIFGQVQELAGQRRHDNAQRLGHNH